MAVVDLATRIASFASAGVKDGVPVNGSWWNCRLSCLLDLSQVRCIGGLVGEQDAHVRRVVRLFAA